MFQDFLMESLQHGLIVTDTVTYRAVGILHVQHRPQGLVHHVDDIKGTGIAVKVDIYFLVFARLLTAVLVQQLVAVFQRASGQQQAALFFVVIYVRFHRHDIECPLALGDIG